MSNDTIDNADLFRLADDGCPNVPDREALTSDSVDL
jgi:hypothetical protein